MRIRAAGRWIAMVVAVLLLAAGLHYLLGGQRYKLHLNADVRACWSALEVVTASTTAATFRRAEGPRPRDDGLAEVRLDYEIGRVFATSLQGSMVCVLRPPADSGPRVVSLRIDGEALDADTLAAVNAALAPGR